MRDRTKTTEKSNYLPPGTEVYIYHVCGDNVLVWHKIPTNPQGSITWLPIDDVVIPEDYQEEGYHAPPRRSTIKLAAVEGKVVDDTVIPLTRSQGRRTKRRAYHILLALLIIFTSTLLYVGFTLEVGQFLINIVGELAGRAP